MTVISVEEMAAFVEARAGEDERLAQAALDPKHPGDWAWRKDSLTTVRTHKGVPVGATSRGVEVGPHIAQWHPRRVLREVAAKRKRIARWRDVDRLWAEWPEGRVGADMRSVRRAFGCAVADDAAVYSWHPDYQVAWDEWANPPD